MNYKAELKNLCALSGPAGYERAVSEKVEALFGQFCQEVWHDSFHNVYARMGRGGPRLMVCAHMDEVGMMVRTIEKDGFLGITKVGGIDPRVLPAHEVVVHGREELWRDRRKAASCNDAGRTGEDDSPGGALCGSGPAG